jgi:dihydrofolate reductase
MRRLRYQIAASLDGYIAGPNGEVDWIIQDPDIDFGDLFATFDAAVMGRKTFVAMLAQSAGAMPGLDVVVYSNTLQPTDHPEVTVINSDPVKHVQSLKAKSGKDIWLFGGGILFRTLLEAGVVDTVEPAVIPVLLGNGIPMLPAPYSKTMLVLTKHRVYQKSGTMLLEYSIRS